MTIKPTLEQQHAINLFKQGSDIVINAFAGTGKTSTLVMLANNSLPGSKGLYIAFNKATVDEAKKKFPKNIHCSTIDALTRGKLKGFDWNIKVFKSGNMNLRKGHIKGYFKSLEIYYYYSFQKSEDTYEDVYLSEDNLFELIFRAILNYFRSEAPTLLPKHVPHLGVMKDMEHLEKTCHLKIYIAKLARKYVSDAFNNQSSTPFCFEGALKLWSLGRPSLLYDFILLDEAQDTNPVFAYILGKQNCQKIIVGDKYQQIYSWRGAINAMDKFDIKNTIYLTQSFRFGSEIADLASSILQLLQEKQHVNGCGPSWVNLFEKQPDAYLCSTNAGVIEVVLELLNRGIAPVVPENIKTFFYKIKELEKILNGKKSNDPLFMGIRNIQQLKSYAQEEPYSELGSYLRLINKFPINIIIAALNQFKNCPQNGPIVTTIHKAKGDEWDFVQIHDEFPSPRQANGIFYLSSDVLNVIYVAITRAKKFITLPNGIVDYIGIAKQKANFQLQTPTKTVTCGGHCPRCSLATLEIADGYDNMNKE